MTAVEPYRPQSAELVQHDPTGGRLVSWAQAATAANQLAKSLSSTSFVPRHFQGNPGDATAAIMFGDELGLSPLAALRSIYMISGTPSMYARTMVALVMSHGHQVWTESSTDTEVVVCGSRKGSEHVERSSWTIARARKAGYTNNKKYESDPQAMLYAKAAGEVARKVAPDVLAGIPHSVEDLELDQPEPATKVSRRRAPQARPEPAEPSFDEPEVSTSERDTKPVQATAERVEPRAAIRPVDPPDGPLTDAQSRKLHALLRESGITDREVGLAYISQVVDKEISSTKELTKSEASAAIKKIEADKGPTEPEPEGGWPEPAAIPGTE